MSDQFLFCIYPGLANSKPTFEYVLSEELIR